MGRIKTVEEKKELISLKRDSREYVFCKFTQDEMNEKSQELAKKNIELEALEGRKKSVMATCSANIAECAARIMVLSNALTNGGEDRYIECVWEMNTPKSGRKTLYKKETNEFVTEAQMQPDDYQLKFEDTKVGTKS